jgi:hypothetical protein
VVLGALFNGGVCQGFITFGSHYQTEGIHFSFQTSQNKHVSHKFEIFSLTWALLTKFDEVVHLGNNPCQDALLG